MKQKKGEMKIKIDSELISYVLGILSIVFAIFNPGAGVVLGIIGLRQSKKQTSDVSKKAGKYNKIGIVVGLIWLIAQIALAYYYNTLGI